MSRLPLEVWASIFTMLDMDELLSSTQVCKAWRDHINATPSLWQHAHFHFKLSKDPVPEGRLQMPTGTATARHKPSAAMVGLRLQDRKLSTLHISAKIGPLYVPDTAVYIQHFITSTLAPLYCAERRQPLHLRLDGFESETILDIMGSITETRSIDEMDIGTGGEQAIAVDLFQTIADDFDVTLLRIHWRRKEPLPFPPEVASLLTSQNDEHVSGSSHGGLAGMSLSVTQPEMARDSRTGCMEITPTELNLPDSLRYLRLTSGQWEIGNTESSLLETLVCDRIWGLSRKWEEYALFNFKHLVRVHVSFEYNPDDPAEAVQWIDLMTFIRCTIRPTLETLYLQLPMRIGGIQQRDYDDVWADQMRKAVRLQELTLVSYFPSTLRYLTEDLACVPPLRTLKLVGYQIYDEVLVSCLPNKLAHLALFDLSATFFNKRVSAARRQSWLDIWRRATSVDFRAPLGYL